MNPEPKPAAHILIVDDDESIRTFLRGVLKLNAYQVSEADGGQAALRSAAAEQPQLIILDLGLPDLDGIEVNLIDLKNLKKNKLSSGRPKDLVDLQKLQQKKIVKLLIYLI